MLFWLKKTLTLPLLPLYLSLALGVVGCLLLWFRRGKRSGLVLVTSSVLILGLASNQGIARLLYGPLEFRYPPVPEVQTAADLPPRLQACVAIVVLGGGHGESTRLSRVNQLVPAALSRVAEGLRLARLLPQAEVVFCGNHRPPPTHARVMAEAAYSLGLAPERAVLFDEPRDTEDEIAAVRARYGAQPVAIVTSASHLPRTLQLCQALEVNAFPCPANYELRDPDDSFFEWDLGALERTSRAIREYVGMLWLKLKGRT